MFTALLEDSTGVRAYTRVRARTRARTHTPQRSGCVSISPRSRGLSVGHGRNTIYLETSASRMFLALRNRDLFWDSTRPDAGLATVKLLIQSAYVGVDKEVKRQIDMLPPVRMHALICGQ